MKCESSVITMTLLWHDYLIPGLGNCVNDTLIETGLSITRATASRRVVEDPPAVRWSFRPPAVCRAAGLDFRGCRSPGQPNLQRITGCCRTGQWLNQNLNLRFA